ncbi:SPX-domain-containing protein [Atractiella rhizophila]|nr:SPX-domain-containing protein [Atractiella rhizophila]
MKFSAVLTFNSVQEWRSYYINYDALKSFIYELEKANLHRSGTLEPTPDDLESSNLLSVDTAATTSADRQFSRLLDKELARITDFYAEKEREVLSDLDALIHDIERMEEESARMAEEEGSELSDEDSEDEREEGGLLKRSSVLVKESLLRAFWIDHRKYQKAHRRRTSSVSSTRSAKQRDVAVHDPLIRFEDPSSIRGDAEALATRSDPLVRTISEEPAPMANGSTSELPRRRTGRSRTRSVSRRKTTGLLPMDKSFLSDGGEDGATMAYTGRESWWSGSEDWNMDAKIMFKKYLRDAYTKVYDLQQYISMNHTGFSKILKKYDKILFSSLRSSYLSGVVDISHPFSPASRNRLEDALDKVVKCYAEVVTRGNENEAKRQLRVQVREHVVWERNTIWREMIGLERKGWSHEGAYQKPVVSTLADETVEGLRIGGRMVPQWVNQKTVSLAVALIVFIVLLNSGWTVRAEERNCAAILAFATILWATEAIPLFVTALSIPFLVVVLRVLRSSDDERRRLTATEATKFIFSQMFSPTIMLLIGGFTIAAALSKQNIDKVLARKVLSFAGTKPHNVLLAYMFVATFSSMWISNVAAPVLCYSLIQPILRTLPPTSAFSKSLILGIALASNVGGQSSPISSPQNLIALEYMHPVLGWGEWFAIAIPVSFISVLLIWLLLLWSFGSASGTPINPVRASKDVFTWTQIFTVVITIVTIALWLVQSQIQHIIGDMGVIAIIPLVAFYGTGVLRKQDWDNLAWSVVFLAMGGIALGKAVLSSGLLDDLDQIVERTIKGLDIFTILVAFSAIVLVLGTFISHTIAAVLVVPLAAEIGSSLQQPHPRLLIMATALVCSAGMGLPVSGFPNMSASNMESELGQRYLQVTDFLKNGIPASVLATLVVITVGYAIMRLLGL